MDFSAAAITHDIACPLCRNRTASGSGWCGLAIAHFTHPFSGSRYRFLLIAVEETSGNFPVNRFSSLTKETGCRILLSKGSRRRAAFQGIKS